MADVTSEQRAAGASRPLLMLDYDGVIVDSLDIFATAFVDVCRAAGIAGIESQEDVLRLFEGNVYASLRAKGADDPAIRTVMRRSVGALERALPWLRPFPLMSQIVAELAAERHLVVVTSNGESLVQAFLRRNHIEGVAEVAGAGAGEGKVAKMERLMAAHPATAEGIYWYVGDTAGDMREARLAGATPLGVAWGWHAPEVLQGAGAEAIAGTPADLLAIVAPELERDFLGLS